MRKKILFVNCETLVRERFFKKLESEGHDVGWTSGRQDAFQTTDFQQADLLLLDLDGPPVETAMILFQNAGSRPRAKVIGLTEHKDMSAWKPGMGLGAVVAKSIDADTLFGISQALLAQLPKGDEALRHTHQQAIDSGGNPQNRSTRTSPCPAVYSGWGIND